MNWVVCPICGIVGLLGKRLTDCSTGFCTTVHATVSCVWPMTPWYSAVTVVVPQLLTATGGAVIPPATPAAVLSLFRPAITTEPSQTESGYLVFDRDDQQFFGGNLPGWNGGSNSERDSRRPPAPEPCYQRSITVKVVSPEIPASVAVIVVVPHPVAVASPVELTVATLGVLEVQLAADVTSSGGVFESFVVPVAINCVVSPIWATLAACGVTATETRCLLLQLPTRNKAESPT